MGAALNWLIGSRAGRFLALAAAALVAFLALALETFKAGKNLEKRKAIDDTLAAARARHKTVEDIGGSEPAARRRRLRAWSRG